MWNVPWAICVPGLAFEKSSATSDCRLAVDGGGIDGGLYGTSVVVGSWKLTAAPGAAALYGTACCKSIHSVSTQSAIGTRRGHWNDRTYLGEALLVELALYRGEAVERVRVVGWWGKSDGG